MQRNALLSVLVLSFTACVADELPVEPEAPVMAHETGESYVWGGHLWASGEVGGDPQVEYTRCDLLNYPGD
jgi:hypothetical protein